MSKNNALVLLVLIIAAGVLMRIVPIRGLTSGVPVSYNVGINTAWASQSIFKYGIAEVVPKDQGFLRYFILHFLLYLGRQERIIGLPALLFGIAALPLIFLTARAFFGVSAGLLSAFLLSFSLWHIRHSTYAEGYTLYAFLALLTIFLFHKALTGRGKWVWAGFSASAIMAVYAFYPNLTILIAGAFWFIIYIRKNKKSIFPVLISIFIILIFIAPVLPGLFCIDKFRGQFNDLWQQGWRLSEALSRLTYLFGGINHYLPVAIFLFFLGAGASFFNDSERRYASLLFLSVVVPWLLILACVFIKISVLERYFFLTYPLFLILVAKGILFFNSRAVRSLCILLVNISLLVFFFSCSIPGVGIGSLIPKDYSPENEGFDFLAAYIKEHYRQGDAVVIEQGKGIFALQYYLDKKNIYPVKKIMPLCGSKSYYQYDGLRIKNIFGLIEYDGSPDRLIKIWREYGRLWLVDLGHIRYFYGADRIQGWIDDSYSQKIKFKGGTIYLFDKYNTKNVSTAYGEYKCRNAVCFLDCPKKIVREFWYPFNTMDKPVYVIGNVPGAVAPFPQWSLESQGDLPPQVQHAQLAFKDGRYQECLKGIEGFLSTNPA
ncbi:MAG: glycosyltransferase family 39 protein, partial [Candidatus Omnitrophota bacterium]